MLKIENLNFSYSRRSKLIESLSITINDGTICGLLGKNGSGKSTLIYLICGLLRQRSGIINSDGYTPYERNVKFLQNTFLVPEEIDLPDITIKNYVRVNSVFYPKFDMERFLKNLELFELNSEMNLGKISMGQRKKALLCFAMACNTKLLILDEPTNGLDITSKRNFRKAISECMTDEKIILISTHQIYDVDKILDHVIIIDKKGVLLNESLSEISSKYKFVFTTDKSRASKALISLEVPGGFNIVEPLDEPEHETEVNIEALFELVSRQNSVN